MTPVSESIEGVSHFGITVADLERSIAFYEDTLGLELVLRGSSDRPYSQALVGYPGAELHGAIFRIPGSESFIEMVEYRGVDRRPVDPGTANPGTAHLCLYVRDLESVHKRLLAAEVRFVSEIQVPDAGPNAGGKVIYMLDPDGIRIELLETSRTFAGDHRRPRQPSAESQR